MSEIDQIVRTERDGSVWGMVIANEYYTLWQNLRTGEIAHELTREAAEMIAASDPFAGVRAIAEKHIGKEGK